ncbi:hypothetical protein BCR33DRAFT_486383 [Rhizoclosmatium globosum]|uniref:Uncharacterized protein n=1 Tax=Rhizoclosmatium globosum TaxID=329046 RepID=A0A1Y2BN52_9FUNG|nr:hypothetical protein BCR33DRAFT_486383 [Rhizoclosmatium globosum]|eukprot:ORY36194.1 hypothetical protein BCR33DRAFT_486383 [Rhizoclosmatium globosum]
MEERLMLDIVDELTWDWTTALANQQTLATGGQLPTPTDSVNSTSSTITTKPTPTAKKRELDEWVQAVRLSSLLSFDPLVSTYGVWEQAQLQAMSRAATNASTVTAKASSSSIMSTNTVTTGSGNGFIQRSLTKLSFSKDKGGRSSPTLSAATFASSPAPESSGWWHHQSSAPVKLQKRDSVVQTHYEGSDLGTSPSTTGEFPQQYYLNQQQQQQPPQAQPVINNKPSFSLFGKGKRVGGGEEYSPVSLSGSSPVPPLVVTELKSEIKIGSSSPKRGNNGEVIGNGTVAVVNQRPGLRGPTAYKPVDPSPLSPPSMSTSISAFSWRDRTRSDPPVYDPTAVPDSPTSTSVVIPFPDTKDLSIGRKRAMSHSVQKTTAVGLVNMENAAAATSSEKHKFFPFFAQKKDVSNSNGGPSASDSKPQLKKKETPSRPSLLSRNFATKEMNNILMKRTQTTTSNSSSMRRVPAKGKKDDKRLSAETSASASGTYRSGFEWTGDVPLVLRKCIKLIEEIGECFVVLLCFESFKTHEFEI